MAENMFADLDGAIIFDGINLETAFDEISPNVASAREKLFETLLRLLVIGQAAGVVIENSRSSVNKDIRRSTSCPLKVSNIALFMRVIVSNNSPEVAAFFFAACWSIA